MQTFLKIFFDFFATFFTFSADFRYFAEDLKKFTIFLLFGLKICYTDDDRRASNAKRRCQKEANDAR